MLRKMSGIFMGLILVVTLPIFSYGQGKVNLTDRGTASVVAQKPESPTPMDKVLIGLWQAIDFINEKFAVTIKGDESPYLITPRGATTTTRPIFEWTPVPNAGGYRIHPWKISISAPKFTYPELWEGLPPGTYTWKVEILIGNADEGQFSEAVLFKILSAQEKSQVEKELPSAKKLSVSDYYILTASIYLKHLFFNEAISNFQKAIEIAPGNPYSYVGLATVYDAIGKAKEAKVKWEEAILHFNYAIKLAPTNPDLHAGLALAYEALGKTEEAQVEWEKAKGSKAHHLLR